MHLTQLQSAVAKSEPNQWSCSPGTALYLFYMHAQEKQASAVLEISVGISVVLTLVFSALNRWQNIKSGRGVP